MVTGIGCMALTYLINGNALYPYAEAERVWNLALRFGAISMVVAIVAGSRSAYIREWWLARTDPLTGAFNRQAFFELAEDLAQVGGWRLLIYADLDGLKRINDRQGHSAGDRAIKDFAAAVRQSIRRDDLFARVGGDEFLILMRVRDRQSAEAVAGRIHGTMNSLAGDGLANLKCSVGALIVPPGEMMIDQIIRGADKLMYQAKLHGASLQVQVANRARSTVGGGRARKASRMPNVAFSAKREPVQDRRGSSNFPRGPQVATDPTQ